MKRFVAAIALVLLLASVASAAHVWVPGYAYYPYRAARVYAYPAPVVYPYSAYYPAPAVTYSSPAVVYPAPPVVYPAPVVVRPRAWYYGYPWPRRAAWGVGVVAY